MWKQASVALLVAASLLAGCSGNNASQGSNHAGHNMQEDGEIAMISVELKVPDEIRVHEEATFEAVVTLKDKPIEKAEKVEFEYWKEGDETHQKEEAVSGGEGVFQLKHAFDQPGKYTIISHVSAEGMHSMPKKEFEVKE
ncbi:FixH family protein [Paenibacillus aquistagni]|uniref:YtkA-like n=1 Tax=Paenibacillus aquistagni TaxID=1852522 RepID=A0A1X7JD33_9BACL|nr:FixH family protein [Paenibacillus aquistagni]SMG25003.1 YtkA-like [Paenibacillus aquistagni]